MSFRRHYRGTTVASCKVHSVFDQLVGGVAGKIEKGCSQLLKKWISHDFVEDIGKCRLLDFYQNNHH
ncbi:hypothetical protein L1887_36247 [Cichorium endivia]|nr:hypothetical protein L1887_36247 [Cichorium endivia]